MLASDHCSTVLSDATASTNPSHKKTKRRKTTCTHCRQRKSKCDGISPQCSTCIAYRTTCRYDKPPSLAYVRSLEERIEQLVREASSRSETMGTTQLNTTSHHFLWSNDGINLPYGNDGNLEGPPHAKCDWITEVSTDVLDGYTETELWEPYYGTLLKNDHNTRLPCMPVEGRLMSCFTARCKLSIILSSIMLDIYGTASAELEHRRDTHSFKASFHKLRSDLNAWWLNLAPNLKLESHRLGKYSQTPHIVSLNLLYHTTLILLHRPLILSGADFSLPAVQFSYQVCLKATDSIYNFLTLLNGTSGYPRFSYLNSYSAYIASTIAVIHYEQEHDTFNEQTQNLHDQNRSSFPHRNASQTGGYTSSGSQDHRSGEQPGVHFFLEVMKRTTRTMPAMKRTVEIVKSHMHSIQERQAKRRFASQFPGSLDFYDNDPSHMDFALGSGGGNQHFEPWLTSECTATHFQATGISKSSNGVDHYPRPVLAPTSFKTEPTEDDVSSSSIFYPYPGEALPVQNLGSGLAMGGDFSENRLDSGGVDPGARQIFSGLNVEPHLRLNHGDAHANVDGITGFLIGLG